MITRSADGTAVGESCDEYCRESVKRTSCQEGVPSSVHVQAVGSCADAEFLKSKLILKRDSMGMCIPSAAGGFPSEPLQQVGRAIEVAVPADSGLGVLPRRGPRFPCGFSSPGFSRAA